MNLLTGLQTLWFFLLAYFFIGYTLLDGFDLGIGLLLPWFRGETAQRTCFRVTGPFWDGNEVWLLMGGACLFAVFPMAYASVLSGFYLPFMGLLFALILRAVSFEFWPLHVSARKLWAVVFTGASFLTVALLGLLLGNVVQGVPVTARQEVLGSGLTLLRPVPVIVALAGLTACLGQGVGYLLRKTEGEVQQRAVQLTGPILLLDAGLSAALCIALTAAVPSAAGRPWPWLGLAVSLGALALAWIALRRGDLDRVFFAVGLAMVGKWITVAGVQFPYLVRSLPEPVNGLTVYNASSGLLTIQWVTGFAVIALTLVLAATLLIYRIFRGKVTGESEEY